MHFPSLCVWIGVVAMPASSVLAARPEVAIPSTNYVIVAPSRSLALARLRELEWSARVFETLLGVPPPRGRIVLTRAPVGSVMAANGEAISLMNAVPLSPQPPAADGTLWVMPWFADEKAAAGSVVAPVSVLTHEAAHMQLVYTVNFHSSAALHTSFNGYGSFLPDWLDEAVAVYHEPEKLKAARRRRFQLTARIALRSFFAMNHPGISGHAQVVEIEARTAEEARQKLAAYEATQHAALQSNADSLVKDAATVDEFYAQALAVIEYMTARGGLPFLRFVVVQQNYGKLMDEVLAAWQSKQQEIESARPAAEKAAAARRQPPVMLARGDPAGPPPPWPIPIAGVLVRRGEAVRAMPATVEALEADFVQWVKQNYPKYRPTLPPFPGEKGS